MAAGVKSKFQDFLERVGWTTVQASAGALLTVLSGANIDWATGLKFVGITTAVAVLKVVIAQNSGKSASGSLPDTASTS